MSISLIIGENIKNLMDKESLSLRKLSEIINISHPTLKKYIDGTQAIDSEKLMKIAEYFGKPFDYFFKNEDQKVKFLFRADKPKESIDRIDIKKLENTIYNYLDVIENTKYSYIPPKYNLRNLIDLKANTNFISKVALEQRRLANIENVIPDNYFKVIQNIGINVIVKDFKNDNYFGASSFSNDYGSYIIINDSDNISEERKIFSLIHEYAHLLFHSNEYNMEANSFYKSSKSDFNEKVANKFAGYFLMPKQLVEMYLESKEIVDIMEMKKYFKVSIQTLYFMLDEYKFISKEQYSNFWRDLNRFGYKEKEPHPLNKIDIKDKNAKLYNKIKEMYLKDEIGANKISEVLGIDNIEIRKMLKEWRSTDERYILFK